MSLKLGAPSRHPILVRVIACIRRLMLIRLQRMLSLHGHRTIHHRLAGRSVSSQLNHAGDPEHRSPMYDTSTVPIYSCPSSSPVRHRMLYSSANLITVKEVKDYLNNAGTSSSFSPRKVETSDPTELNEQYLVAELGWAGPEAPTSSGRGPTADAEKKPFARPKGPGRKR